MLDDLNQRTQNIDRGLLEVKGTIKETNVELDRQREKIGALREAW